MKIYLDLLPKQRKMEIRRKKIFRMILRAEFLLLLPILLFIIVLLNIFYLVSVERSALASAHLTAKSQEKYQELSSYEEKFKTVNENSSLLLKLESGHLHWVWVLEKMNKIMPEGIVIGDLSTKNYRIFLLGTAKNRDLLLKFKDELEKDQCFENINVPLSNLVVKENVDFQMDFSVKRSCLVSGS